MQIYEKHRVDLYCGCAFTPEPGHGLRVDFGRCGYVPFRDATRAGRIEWEHVVAAATFGRTFTEWTQGIDRCVDGKGKRFKGRKCAGKSPEFARMEGDLHNLFPVVGEVNGIRGDLPVGILDPPDHTPAHHKPTTDVFTFGACKSTIDRGVFQPRPEVRGDMARASLYMDRAYPSRHILDDAHRALFERWSAEDPPDEWERERNRAIAERQGNENPFISAADRAR
jgi:deoxyribonuclease-1